MKRVLTIIFSFFCLLSSATTYYVATNGNDKNAGTLDSPWYSWGKACSAVRPGDIVYIRGGIYVPSDIDGCVFITNKSGTTDNPISIFNYPGETPILDLSEIRPDGTGASLYGFKITYSNNWHIKGLTIRNLKQPSTGGYVIGFISYGCDNLTVENLTVHNIGGPGFVFGELIKDITILNCDSYDNYDNVTNGENANGFSIMNGSSETNVQLIGCRAWSNSDDGFDNYGLNGKITYESCWAFDNGNGSGGDGLGFKLGPQGYATNQIYLKYCIASGNSSEGFGQNAQSKPIIFYNNTTYKNGTAGFDCNSGSGICTFRNNVAYSEIKNEFNSNAVHDHNTWDYSVNVSSADFLSTDASQLRQGRDSDSSLPDIEFMKLASGSDLIDAGIDVGLPFSGSSPDLGAFEKNTGSSILFVPVYQSSSIENATPTKLEMTYNLSLANIVPSSSAFTVIVNSLARAVSSVAVSGTRVSLTLASSVAYGNAVTVAYTKPSANPLHTSAGGQAATISAQSVTNRVVEINAAPVVVVTSPQNCYSGFVGQISAERSYDANRDNLNFSWSAQENITMSSRTGAAIKFLSPIVSEPTTVQFTVKVSDGKTIRSEVIPVEILPYKPELETATILNIEASSYQSPNYPHNAIDENIGTMWSANGIDEYLVLELKESFSIQHLKLAFQPGQKRESYFDISGSNDRKNWEPILIKSASCDFSGDMQVFDFPRSKAEREYRYVKLTGQGNLTDKWNYISEIRIYGYRHHNPEYYENLAVKVYPNPAREVVNIRIDEAAMAIDFIRVLHFSGETVYYYNKLGEGLKEFQIPIKLANGNYLVQIGFNDVTLSTQKLIVIH